MKRRHWGVIAIIVLVLGGLVAALALFVRDASVLNPSGQIAVEQRNLLYLSTAIMSAVAVPVFGLLFFIAWRYRETNKKARYTPEHDSDNRLEVIWWGIPIVIVCFLGFVAWQTSHTLDPFRRIEADQKQLTVQVVALQWKWLFIYPEQGVASVNELAIPTKRPVSFQIAADAPMNSFWIPDLGGQIYAMNGMNTQLHLVADKPGTYRGVSANISGEGFADMRFAVKAMSDSDFTQWTQHGQLSPQKLDDTRYAELAKPSTIDTPQHYQLGSKELYTMIINKYHLSHSTTSSTHKEGSN